jgi:hypothetical protein
MKLFLAFFLPCLAFAAEQLRILPVSPTPESGTVVLAIAIPKPDQVVKRNPMYIQFRIEGYPLEADSQFPRNDELAVSKMGQTVHIIIDDRPYFAVNGPAIDPFDESGYYYDTSYKIEVPFELKEGFHVLRAFPARSFGESLKGETCVQITPFYVGSQTGRPDVDLSKPFLTYNEPSDQFRYVEGRPILLDFLVTNCELTRDGYKVKLTVDGKANRMLTSWQPYYLYGLTKGNHTIRLELIDRLDKQVPGKFNHVERTITVH